MSFRLRQGILAQTALPEAIVLDTRDGAYFELNAVASLMLTRLLAGATPAQAIEAVTREFDVDAERASADLDAFIAQLRARDWLAEDA